MKPLLSALLLVAPFAGAQPPGSGAESSRPQALVEAAAEPIFGFTMRQDCDEVPDAGPAPMTPASQDALSDFLGSTNSQRYGPNFQIGTAPDGFTGATRVVSGEYTELPVGDQDRHGNYENLVMRRGWGSIVAAGAWRAFPNLNPSSGDVTQDVWHFVVGGSHILLARRSVKRHGFPGRIFSYCMPPADGSVQIQFQRVMRSLQLTTRPAIEL